MAAREVREEEEQDAGGHSEPCVGPGAPSGVGRLALATLLLVLLLRILAAVQGYRTPVIPNSDEDLEVFRSLRYASGDLNPKISAWGGLSSLLLFVLYGTTYVVGRVVAAFASTQDFLRLY